MVWRPGPRKIELEARRLVLRHHHGKRPLEINDPLSRNQKRTVQNCATLLARRSRVHRLLANRVHGVCAQGIEYLACYPRGDILPGVAPQIVDLPLKQIPLSWRSGGGLALESAQLIASFSEPLLEHTRLHVHPDDEFLSIGEPRERLPQLVATFGQHRLYLLRVAEKSPHWKWNHRARIRRPRQHAIVRNRALAHPVDIGGERLDSIRRVIGGADRGCQRERIRAGNERHFATVNAGRGRRGIERRAGDSIDVAEPLDHWGSRAV